MRKITKIARGLQPNCATAAGLRFGGYWRSGGASRANGSIDRHKLKQRYGQLLNATNRVVGQAKRFSEWISQGAVCEGLEAVGAGRAGTR
jgi:hypothetical protein